MDYDKPTVADKVTIDITRLPARTLQVWLFGRSSVANRTHPNYRVALGISSTTPEGLERQQVKISTHPLSLAGMQRFEIGSTSSESIFAALD